MKNVNQLLSHEKHSETYEFINVKQNYDQNVLILMYAHESGTGFIDQALTGQLVVREERFSKKYVPALRVQESITHETRPI